MKTQRSYETFLYVWHKEQTTQDDLNSGSLQQLLFKTIFTYFNAINGNMNSVEANSPWRPVCTVSPIIIDTN